MSERESIKVTPELFRSAVSAVSDICETGTGSAESAVRTVAEIFGIDVKFLCDESRMQQHCHSPVLPHAKS